MSTEPIDTAALQASVQEMLVALRVQDDPETNGTPARVAEFWSNQLISGYQGDPASLFRDAIDDQSGTIVSLIEIPFHGVCPHHLVPFFGHVDLAYEPNGRIVGLGSLEKLVAMLSRRLILQEALTGSIADTLMTHLDAKGACVRITAQHLCFMLRGREPRRTQIVTHASRGTLNNQFHFVNSGGVTPPERSQ